MGTGLGLAVLGAILAFAVRAEPEAVDIQTIGLILILAGAVVIWNARRTSTRERIVTRTEMPGEGYENTTVLRERNSDRRAG